MIGAALQYAERGQPVFPVAPFGKLPAISREAGGRGVLDATTDARTIEAWWRADPRRNIGLACISFWALDVDPDADGEQSLLELTERHGPLPPTLIQATPSGGRHYLFRQTEAQIRNRASDIAPGLDTRSTGGYILGAPSKTRDGCYRWIARHPIADAPSWLITLASKSRHEREAEARPKSIRPRESCRGTAYALAALRDEADAVRAAPHGQRNDTLNRAAYALGRFIDAGDLPLDGVARELIDAPALLVSGSARSDPHFTALSAHASGMQRHDRRRSPRHHRCRRRWRGGVQRGGLRQGSPPAGQFAEARI